MIIDIWGEPNGSQNSWTSTDENFFKIFRMAHDTIRSMPGGDIALICGPAASTLDVAFLTSFLDYAVQHSLQLDVINWHEFRSGNSLFQLSDNIQQFRSSLSTSPYSSLGVEKILITEFLPFGIYNNPGAIISYFNELETGGANGGCKACWDESNTVSNCWNSSLDGLLVNGTFEKRAAWCGLLLL